MRALFGEVSGRCECGYEDSRFCPAHGHALKRVVMAGPVNGEKVAEMFADPRVLDVCLGCWKPGAYPHASWCAEVATADDMTYPTTRKDIAPSARSALEWAERHGEWRPLADDVRHAREWRARRGLGGQSVGPPAGACWSEETIDFLAEQCRAHGVEL